MRKVLTGLSAGFWVAAALAQNAEAPKFDVASVKLAETGDSRPAEIAYPGARLTAANAPLRMLLRFAYELKDYQIEVKPLWAERTTFYIDASADSLNALPDVPSRLPAMRRMLQALLVERFQMTMHRETREVLSYRLVVDSKGLKMKQAGEADQTMLRPGRGSLSGKAAPVGPLVTTLSMLLGRPVVDATGLAGRFNYDLKFAVDGQEAAGDLPTVYTALPEQLGLRLEPAKLPTEILVVDRASMPGAN